MQHTEAHDQVTHLALLQPRSVVVGGETMMRKDDEQMHEVTSLLGEDKTVGPPRWVVMGTDCPCNPLLQTDPCHCTDEVVSHLQL
mmetsp:Transcript_7116/g.18366  ORF Transcript_7116/g.18366 Transcript_7116/m.18366 type:complete len:85 (-) Transcript_7116:2695-2949(-)